MTTQKSYHESEPPAEQVRRLTTALRELRDRYRIDRQALESRLTLALDELCRETRDAA